MRSTYVFTFTSLLAASPTMGQVVVQMPEPEAGPVEEANKRLDPVRRKWRLWRLTPRARDESAGLPQGC